MDDSDKEDKVTLRLLQAIGERSDISQRGLSQRLGVALGLTNSYLKRCVKKGLVKFKQVPANRYAYYLTPKGFAEKSRLTATYLTASFDFYRVASLACKDALDTCQHNGWRKIVLCGMSELCEIAVVRIHESDLEIQGIYSPWFERVSFLNFPVFRDLDGVPEADGYLITDVLRVDEFTEEMRQRGLSDRILIPDVLREVAAINNCQ